MYGKHRWFIVILSLVALGLAVYVFGVQGAKPVSTEMLSELYPSWYKFPNNFSVCDRLDIRWESPWFIYGTELTFVRLWVWDSVQGFYWLANEFSNSWEHDGHNYSNDYWHFDIPDVWIEYLRGKQHIWQGAIYKENEWRYAQPRDYFSICNYGFLSMPMTLNNCVPENMGGGTCWWDFPPYSPEDVATMVPNWIMTPTSAPTQTPLVSPTPTFSYPTPTSAPSQTPYP